VPISKPQLVIIDPVADPATGPDDRLRVADPDQPVIQVTDLAVTRGDGVFETLGVTDGSIQAVGPHLRRLQHSAAMLDLPELDLETIERGVRMVVDLHEPVPELLVKLIVTRGIEGTGRPTAFAYAFVGEDYGTRRRTGTTVATLDRGYRSDVAQTSPWLLQGAKTLSYAVNMAALREAQRRGAEDVIFVSTDGYVLEAPRSTVIVRLGEEFVTPRTDFGILEGTTQAAVWEILAELGYRTSYRAVERSELDRADALWLVSSGQQITPVTELDGVPVERDDELTSTLLKRLQERSA
jgi:4-amino-4-deoxychorismate lyase